MIKTSSNYLQSALHLTNDLNGLHSGKEGQKSNESIENEFAGHSGMDPHPTTTPTTTTSWTPECNAIDEMSL